MDISYELHFHNTLKLHVYGLGIKRNRQNTAVLKTVMKIILRNDCKNSHFAARMGLTLSSMARSCDLLSSSSFFFCQRK